MADLIFRHAVLADLAFMMQLIAADDVGEKMDDWIPENVATYEKAFAEITADPHQEVYVVELDGQLIGTFQITYIPGLMRRGMWRGLIESVHVIPEARNRGHGTAMLRWIAAHCRQRGCGLVQLTSNKARDNAHRFYRKLGFAQSHEGFRLFV